MSQYSYVLNNECGKRASAEMAYYFYAALLQKVPERFASYVHEDSSTPTPISQYISFYKGKPIWTVSLLGENCEEVVAPVLDTINSIYISRLKEEFELAKYSEKHIYDVNELLVDNQISDVSELNFLTPCAFKSQGQEIFFPSTKLIVRSLVKKWNGCIAECPIEDNDGEGIDAIADGLNIISYDLHSEGFRIKSGRITGFKGKLYVENRLSGFHKQMANALFRYSDFSGVGMKTTLGMGGLTVK